MHISSPRLRPAAPYAAPFPAPPPPGGNPLPITPPFLRPGPPSPALPPAAAVAGIVAKPAHATTLTRTPLATGLSFPNALTVAPDGRVFYGERITGKIGWID